MTLRGCLTLTLFTALTLGAGGERWSRQVSNSEWIPLANPRAAPTQVSQSTQHVPPPLPPLTLPPALQHQYQQQLLQLQKTQENIQKLLLLQQQLRAQQHILQSQTFLPSGFGNQGDEKPLHPSTVPNLSSVSELGPEVLVPPLPSSEALPPVFPPQNFLLQQAPEHLRQKGHQSVEGQEELLGSSIDPSAHGFKRPQLGHVDLEQNEDEPADLHDSHKEYVIEHEAQRHSGKRAKGHALSAPRLPSIQTDDDNEEVQLVYVPAETLAQRGQPKRTRGRKYHYRQQQQQQQQQQHQYHHQPQLSQNPNEDRDNEEVESTTSAEQDAFARSLLEQLQREREEKTQFLKEERMKEINRLNEEQRALERKVRLQQEAIQREQEIQRQRDAEKKKKELEKLEEMAKQRELQRIREAREKQRQEEIERRRLAERRKEEEQRQLEEKATTPVSPQESHPLSLPLVRESGNSQLHRQHLTETSRPAKRFRGRQRQRPHQYHDQTEYREASTAAPSPNQPPLSVYMGAATNNRINVKVTDVLKILKGAKTIAVLDTVGPDAPQVFVGPTSLDPPTGYAKFDLPYLSSIDHNRVERKVDKLPFFVAPLSFDPPAGYSKIPFPAPHIGSVVVNTIDTGDGEKDADNRSPNPTPLIEPNSYIEGPRSDQNGPSSTTPTYESPSSNSPVYTPEASSTPRYEPQFGTSSTTTSTSVSTSSSSSANTGPGSAGRFRFKQFYGDSKPASVISTSYHSEQLPTRVKQKPYYPEEGRSSSPVPVQNQQFDSSVSYRDELIYSSTPSFQEGSFGTSQDPTTREQDLAAQLALINQELAQHRNVVNKYNGADQYHVHHRNPNLPTGPGAPPVDDTNAGDINDVRTPIGPTHYSLPSELPAISPLLPGLVNSLIDKHESTVSNIPISSNPATLSTSIGATGPFSATTTSRSTTTTATMPPPTTMTPATTTTTTYRPRGRHRGRVVSTRPPTTQAPSGKGSERPRRPYSRSRSRYTTTTTEDYRDSAFDSTKAQAPETTQRYNGLEQHSRRTSPRGQKYRNRDRNSQSEAAEQVPNLHRHRENYEHSQQASVAMSAPSAPSGPFVQDSPSTGPQAEKNVEPTTVSTPESFLQQRPHQGASLAEEYARGENYPRPDDLRYQFHQPPSGFDQVNLEKSPVNGFNYQVHGEPGDENMPQGQRDFPYYAAKLENSEYAVAVTTEDPRIGATDEQSYSTLFDLGQPRFERLENGKIRTADGDNDHSTDPIFLPLPDRKQELYGTQQSTETLQPEPTTEAMTTVTTSTTTTTQSPVIIRQRVRGRGRAHQDSAIQTRPRGSQDEYVRVSAVNRQRDGTRVRSRVRPQSDSQGQIQTDGYDYVKIHAGHHHHHQQQQQPIVTTTPAPLTTLTAIEQPLEIEEDIDYGFIRPPSFRPIHPVDNRFHQQPVTFRPLAQQMQSHVSLANDEAAVESSPSQTQTQLYKNRPKYQHAPGRRPSSPRATTTMMTMTTTTESSTLPTSDTVYTVRPKTRPTSPDEQKTRIRGRIRRPGRRRTTTTTSTTESGLDANNELPPDENYPRIYEGQPIYDENFQGPSAQFLSSRDRTAQLYDVNGANYANPDFVLNFGNEEERSAREEYDQTQLASDVPRRYQHHPARSKSSNSDSTPIDIYGAESQWSTKLTKTSFQPSFASNRVPAASKGVRNFGKIQSAPEIITAGPEVSSVTFLVSSNDGYNEREMHQEDEASIIMGTTVFGKKTTPQYNNERPNATFETSTVQSTRERSLRPSRYEEKDESYMVDGTEMTKIAKKIPGEAGGSRKAGRRKRVRVRVRPLTDDFVTAESQHFNSAVNSLSYDQYEYNPVREYRLTTTESPSVSTAADEPTRRSVFQDFLEEMLKEDQAAVPVLATSTSTELPPDAWLTSLPTTASEADGDTTFKEILDTTMPTDIEKEPAVAKLKNETSITMARSNFNREDPIEALETLESLKTTEQDDGSKSTDSFGLSSERMKTNDLESESLEATRVYANTELAKTAEYPKNHREKWSEVRYPSAFDRSRIAGWNYESVSPSISGLIRNKNEPSVKSLSDYVKAIFDTMKSEDASSSTASDQETTVADSTTLTTGKEETTTNSTPEATASTESTTEARPDSTETTFAALRSSEPMPTTKTEDATEPAVEGTTLPSPTETTSDPTSDSFAATTTSLPPTSSATGSPNSTEPTLGKVLRTSTTTKVSHMTEICYRGLCVMTKPKKDDVGREERMPMAAMVKKDQHR